MNMDASGFGTDLIGTAIVVIGFVVTAWVFVLAFKMSIWPGEKNPDHPKHAILREDH